MNEERILEFVPYFRVLRQAERVRLLERVSFVQLEPGQVHPLGAEWVLIMDGEAELTLEGGRPLRLFTSDSYGEVEAITHHPRNGTLKAIRRTQVASMPAEEFSGLLAELPVMTVEFLAELARDLKAENDLLRDANAAQNEGLAQAQLTKMVERGLRKTRRNKRSLLRHAGKVLWHTLVRDPSRQPTFWIFMGLVTALAGARSVVAFILANGLQKKLFALVESRVGHPIHVHHFNYGLLITGVVGLISMAPGMRRYLRGLGFAFGVGMGLVVDEFALFWNLNPDYYQAESRTAAALLVFVMFQIVYFYKLYVGLLKRALAAAVDL